ncbi:hypothetical protein BCR36DRAFT_408191 [Piromyces finnis]|uniref:PH domain-containing protein n=1 Tax=Piromyces finnis TaxID=1754191 RepID=A0A1Y1VQ14_9FUNG|nr:hypothetical protein BCR36DRAFT_408191 [Piromyces finnis]|eukprot:ORX61233.1 hypothetical protein BCR36DRAFT_408191 [Piromyces finnis]
MSQSEYSLNKLDETKLGSDNIHNRQFKPLNKKKTKSSSRLSKNENLLKTLSYNNTKSSIDISSIPPSDITNKDLNNIIKPIHYSDVENTLKPKKYIDGELIKPKHYMNSSLIPLKSINMLNSNSTNLTSDDESESGFSNCSYYSNISALNKNSSFVSNVNEDNNLLNFDTQNTSFVSSVSNISSINLNSEIVMEGWIQRKRKLQTYKNYYMVAKKRMLKAGILYFYRTDQDSKSQPLFTVDLSDCSDIIFNTTSNNSILTTQHFEFKLLLRKNELVLATNSLETTEIWYDAINQLIPKISKRSFDNLKQEVNNLQVNENNLKGENSRLTNLVEFYKKNNQSLEESKKQLEIQIFNLNEKLSKMEISNVKRLSNIEISEIKRLSNLELAKIKELLVVNANNENYRNSKLSQEIVNLDQQHEDEIKEIDKENCTDVKNEIYDPDTIENDNVQIDDIIIISPDKLKEINEKEKYIESENNTLSIMKNGSCTVCNSSNGISINHKFDNIMDSINEICKNQTLIMELFPSISKHLNINSDELKPFIIQSESSMENEGSSNNINIANSIYDYIIGKLDNITNQIETNSTVSASRIINALKEIEPPQNIIDNNRLDEYTQYLKQLQSDLKAVSKEISTSITSMENSFNQLFSSNSNKYCTKLTNISKAINNLEQSQESILNNGVSQIEESNRIINEDLKSFNENESKHINQELNNLNEHQLKLINICSDALDKINGYQDNYNVNQAEIKLLLSDNQNENKILINEIATTIENIQLQYQTISSELNSIDSVSNIIKSINQNQNRLMRLSIEITKKVNNIKDKNEYKIKNIMNKMEKNNKESKDLINNIINKMECNHEEHIKANEKKINKLDEIQNNIQLIQDDQEKLLEIHINTSEKLEHLQNENEMLMKKINKVEYNNRENNTILSNEIKNYEKMCTDIETLNQQQSQLLKLYTETTEKNRLYNDKNETLLHDISQKIDKSNIENKEKFNTLLNNKDESRNLINNIINKITNNNDESKSMINRVIEKIDNYYEESRKIQNECSKLENMNNTMISISQNQCQLKDSYSETNEKLDNIQYDNKKLIEDIGNKIESNYEENKNKMDVIMTKIDNYDSNNKKTILDIITKINNSNEENSSKMNELLNRIDFNHNENQNFIKSFVTKIDMNTDNNKSAINEMITEFTNHMNVLNKIVYDIQDMNKNQSILIESNSQTLQNWNNLTKYQDECKNLILDIMNNNNNNNNNEENKQIVNQIIKFIKDDKDESTLEVNKKFEKIINDMSTLYQNQNKIMEFYTEAIEKSNAFQDENNNMIKSIINQINNSNDEYKQIMNDQMKKKYDQLNENETRYKEYSEKLNSIKEDNNKMFNDLFIKIQEKNNENINTIMKNIMNEHKQEMEGALNYHEEDRELKISVNQMNESNKENKIVLNDIVQKLEDYTNEYKLIKKNQEKLIEYYASTNDKINSFTITSDNKLNEVVNMLNTQKNENTNKINSIINVMNENNKNYENVLLDFKNAMNNNIIDKIINEIKNSLNQYQNQCMNNYSDIPQKMVLLEEENKFFVKSILDKLETIDNININDNNNSNNSNDNNNKLNSIINTINVIKENQAILMDLYSHTTENTNVQQKENINLIKNIIDQFNSQQNKNNNISEEQNKTIEKHWMILEHLTNEINIISQHQVQLMEIISGINEKMKNYKYLKQDNNAERNIEKNNNENETCDLIKHTSLENNKNNLTKRINNIMEILGITSEGSNTSKIINSLKNTVCLYFIIKSTTKLVRKFFS